MCKIRVPRDHESNMAGCVCAWTMEAGFPFSSFSPPFPSTPLYPILLHHTFCSKGQSFSLSHSDVGRSLPVGVHVVLERQRTR